MISLWQSIETAPEGTEIVVWDPARKDFYKARGDHWGIADKYHQPHEWFCFGGEDVTRLYPSHWMLPEPPTE